ncbi:MAG: ribose ABC transporter permease [Desulfuromonadales bacterium]|nr:ribose ABC transporter permease [Desulfuromonadales bacterium]
MNHQFTSILKRYGIAIAFVLVCVILAILSPVFLRWNNILNVIRQSSIIGIMAVGVTFVILTGGIDLSVGSVMAAAGMIAAGAMQNGAGTATAILIGLAVGVACGLVNGYLITVGKITPFVVTLGMMSIARGITLIYSQGYPISGFSPSFRFIGGGVLLGIPFPIILLLLSVVVAWFILTQTRLGRYTYAVGGNEETVTLSGISSSRIKLIVYGISGFASGVSALILTSRLNSAGPTAGIAYELDVIASVVIGGTSLNGGRGSVWGTLIGALLIAIINNGMNLLGISPYFQQLVKGLIIIGAVLIDRLREQD